MGVISSEELSWCLAYPYEHLGRCFYNTESKQPIHNILSTIYREQPLETHYPSSTLPEAHIVTHNSRESHTLCDLWGLKFHKSSREIKSDVLGA